MNLKTFEENVSIHQALGDNPNTDNALSADEVKAKFDLAAERIQRYLNEHVVPAVNSKLETLSEEDISGIADVALAKAKESGEFNGADGKSAYQYAKDAGYEGTEEDFANMMAHDRMQFAALATGTAIAKNTDLDTATAFGNYKCTSSATAKTLLNCPVDTAFVMRVGSPAPGVANYFYQEIITLTGVRHYRYGQPSSGVLKWNNWRKTFDTNEIIPARFGGMGANISSDLGEEAHLNAVQKFVDKMNEMAANIGMVNTTFKTPSGLNRKPVNVGKEGVNNEYNSHTTAYDLLRLMVAVKHTPNVLTAMGSVRCNYFKNGGAYYAQHSVLDNSNWRAWAEENGYTILAAKGGSLSGEYGEIGSNGILNFAFLIQSNGEVYAVSVVGLNNEEFDVLRTIIHDLISGVANSTAISEASSRAYPVGMAVAKLSGKCFDEDITALENGTFYNEHEVRATASVAKIMTALVASHHMGNHECSVNYDDLVGGAEAVTFAVGDKISTTDALSLMLAVSDNTMATMLARVCGEKGGTGEPDLSGLVKSVNGVTPDENGNVEITIPDSGGNAENGEDGFSPIAKVEQTATGAVISITDKGGTTSATITNGKDGKDGVDGQPGKDGADGAPGEKGDKGDKGDPGEPGQKGDKGDPGEKGDTGAPGADGAKGDKGDKGDTGAQGEPGKDGENGKDGTSATHSWNGTVLTVTSASGTSSADLKGAKGDKGDKGDAGQRGTGLLPVTTAPASYTTAVGGITPKYRMAISTIKTQAGVTEVLLGDTVQYSYYHYPIDYLDASYAYFTTRVSIRGATGDAGTSPTVDVSKSGKVTTISITDSEGTKTATINDGADGVSDTANYMGKKILFMGDSMMVQSQPTHGWIGLFNEIIQPSSFVNTAVSGATYTETASTVYDGNPVSTNQVNNVIGNQIEKIARGKDTTNPNYSKVEAYAEFDIIIIAAGINDYSIKTDEPDIENSFTTSSAVVELSTLDRKNFASAFRYNIERVQKLYPTAKIFVCTPTQVALGSRTYKSVKEKRNHIIALCERMSITYIDTFMCGIYSVKEVNNGAGLYLKDGVHPNDAGKAVIANYNAREVIKYYIGSAVDVPIPEITYTNLVPTSVDANGSVFNGTGYQNDARINSSGATSTSNAQYTTATGFIKVSGGDVVRISGGQFMNTISANANAIGVYGSTKNHLGTTTIGGSAYGIFGNTYGAYSFSSVVEETTGVYKWVVPPTASGVEWIRLSCYGKNDSAPGANLIVTVNQEIK